MGVHNPVHNPDIISDIRLAALGPFCVFWAVRVRPESAHICPRMALMAPPPAYAAYAAHARICRIWHHARMCRICPPMPHMPHTCRMSPHAPRKPLLPNMPTCTAHARICTRMPHMAPLPTYTAYAHVCHIWHLRPHMRRMWRKGPICPHRPVYAACSYRYIWPAYARTCHRATRGPDAPKTGETTLCAAVPPARNIMHGIMSGIMSGPNQGH